MNTPLPFRVTPDAARQILAQAAQAEAPPPALRVAARQEADGSFSYGMGFDTLAADDQPLEFSGLTVVFAAGCEPLLQGTVLDFVELEPGRHSFIFIPPEAARPAPSGRGCGSGACGGCSCG
ncbi:MAG: iron-sulfur cluster assembly accessory protein [Pseudomonadota bacterium]